MRKFAELGLNPPILRAVEEAGYTEMTPIQTQAIPSILEGRDLIGVAQTGTGKTAAFALPIIQKLLKGEGKRSPKTTRSLILAPTRELAVQIGDNVNAYGKYLHLRSCLVYGGVSDKPQIKALQAGVDILIATPGRLLDLMGQGYIGLQDVEFLVLDEADRMLDMGFIRDIKKIIEKLPKQRQTVLFSATMPNSVKSLANGILRDPIRVEVTPAATTVEKITQHVFMVPKNRKRDLLAHVLKDSAISRVLIFTRTKHGANKVAKNLEDLGISSSAIHGNKSQNARQKALNEFRSGSIRALVATDVAARGIDVDGVTHVINFELPNEPDSYVHRIGRTARAGASGVSLSFCDHEERGYLRDIEKTIRQEVPMIEDHPYHMEGIQIDYDDGKDDADNNRRPGKAKAKPHANGRRPASRRSQGQGKSQPAKSPSAHAGGGKPGQAKPAAGGGRKRRPANRRPGPAVSAR
ncbi:MAG: DEAD/DEAH box helicase [Rhodospirillales bacterium]|nr:DEAD/DEAH box helicase [Rhodospirillales bacterium]